MPKDSQWTGEHWRRMRSDRGDFREDRQRGGSERIRYRENSQHDLLREGNTDDIRGKFGRWGKSFKVVGTATEERSHRGYHRRDARYGHRQDASRSRPLLSVINFFFILTFIYVYIKNMYRKNYMKRSFRASNSFLLSFSQMIRIRRRARRSLVNWRTSMMTAINIT